MSFLGVCCCGAPSAECCSEPSCALSLFHLKLVCSRSATLDLATARTRLSPARDLKYWTWRLHCCFAGTGHQHVLDLLWISLGIFWIICTCLCICASFTMFCCVAVFWHCISAGTSTFMCCCCETSVISCIFWMILLRYCTCGNFNDLCILWSILSIYCTW